MDYLGLAALILVVAGKVLDYVAPKTSTKIDDGLRDLVHKVLPMLPAAKAATATSAQSSQARAAATIIIEPTKPAPETKAVVGLGFNVRDHRDPADQRAKDRGR